MAEVQLKRGDVAQWRAHYMQWRECYGIGSAYIQNLLDVVKLATQDDGLAIEQRVQLGILVRQIGDEREASVTVGDRLEKFQ